MEEGGGVERESNDEISLLAEELIQLSIKRSLVVPSEKPTLICSVWTKKYFNPESFRAQMKSIGKSKKKFEIQMVGQNLFSIVFDLEEDLEFILEGPPWLFRKSIILFDRLKNPTERDQICLTSSPYWVKIGMCPPEFDKKDMLHAIGSTFVRLSRGTVRKIVENLLFCLEILKEGILARWEDGLEVQEGNLFLRKNVVQKAEINKGEEILKTFRKASWKRLAKNKQENKQTFSSDMIKRKLQLPDEEDGETKLNQKCMEKVRRSCGFNSGIDIEAEGSRGGLCLTWKSDIVVTLRSFSKWHIDVIVREGSIQQEWRFTGFYGSPYLKDRRFAWNLLRRLSQGCNHPWLVVGDFNEILYSFEKSGGVPREQKRMEAFRDTLEECQLMDIGYSGVWFTWERGNLPETNIRERLDRWVANEAWLLLFPMRNIQYLPHSTSDHCPLLLSTDNSSTFSGSRRFHFEAWWTTEESFEGLIREFWESSNVPLLEKLKQLQIHLKEWAGSIRSRKEGLKKRLTKELEFLLGKDRDDETLEITEGSEILETATEYFEDLFASKGIGDSRKVMEGIKRIIPNEFNESLLSPFCEDEVRVALKGMRPTKAPGSDGFPALFFQQYWHIMGSCIDEVQSAFVPGHLITDNVLLAYEILHTFRQKRTRLKGYMAVKLDMSKAYDKVEWDFVKKMMIKMGFAQEWVGLIMKCITSVSYAVNINGHRGRVFQPSRGLRQGDPLSPFLFLICNDDLSSLMRSAKQSGLVKGARVSSRGPEISHLLFADDCMMFGEATEQGVRNMKENLKEYESCSGVRNSSSPEKYLGLPNVVGKQKKETFQNILDKISLRIDSWSSRSKEEGGLGFRNMAQFNIALLAKQGWRLLTSPDSLVARVFKAKYFPDCNFQFSRLGSSSSYVWRSIWAAKASLEKGLIWKVGTGENISVFEDAWIPNYENVRLKSEVGNLHFVKVADLINSNEREWNRSLIGNTFLEAEAELILQIPLAMKAHEDLLVWNGELSDEFSVRSSYILLQNCDPTAYALQDIYRGFYNKLWKIDIPLKIKLFIWKISLNYLATRVNMSLRNLTSNSLCPRCGVGEETMNHLFRGCPVSVTIWTDLSDVISVLFPSTEFVEWLTKAMANLPLNVCRLFCVTLWAIWEDRNSRIHDKKNRSSKEIVSFIHGYIKELDAVRKVNQSTFTEVVKWNSPPGQTVKINFDGAFGEKSKLSALGIVVRDSNDFVLLTSTELHKGVISAFVTEAIACRQATQIALDINREEVIIEGDSLSIIKKCNKRDFDKSQVGSYIHDIHELKSKVTKVRFEFVPRSANILAHILATESLRRKERVYLENRVPSHAETQSKIEFAREPD
ncbi:reverse transcriptase [Gossypium australe]|uniref:Reverse transcriptase n=1 Tax=Gossypium australe TaxID=47621 RepID=A0A5B6UWB9_9ROSI|nr:reverse transcriptase [Gossypium australe]